VKLNGEGTNAKPQISKAQYWANIVLARSAGMDYDRILDRNHSRGTTRNQRPLIQTIG